MNENTYIVNDHEIKLISLVYKVLLQWKLIVLAACIFAVLGYGYAKYKQNQQAEMRMQEGMKTEQERSVEDLQEEETIDFVSVEDNTYDILQRYETALNNESNYMDNSLLMQMDPYHMVSALQEFEIRVEGDVDINELSMIGRQLLNSSFDTEVVSRIADKYDTEPQFIRELISADVRENEYGLDGVQILGSTSESDGHFTSDENVENYYFYVLVKSNDKEISTDMIQMIIEHIQQKSHEVSQIEFDLTELPMIIIESVDNGVISAQNNARVRAFDYSDRFVKLSTILDNLELVKKSNQESEIESIKHYSGKKYAALGFAGGAILIVLVLLLKNMFSATFQTESDFRSWFTLNNLGTAPVLDEKKKINGFRKRFLGKLNGPSSKLSQEMFYRMVSTNLINASSGRETVLLTGAVDQENMQQLSERLTPVLSEKCNNTEYVFAYNLLENPESRAHLQKADGIVLVEKRNCSKIEEVKEEIEIIAALNKEILGVILL